MTIAKIQKIQRVALIRDICRGKRVLHLGCTNYPYTDESLKSGTSLHMVLTGVAASVWGIDAQVEGIELMKSAGIDQIVRGDLEKLDEVDLDEQFDVIVAGEMIEHLNNPGLFLDGIKRFMGDETQMILTTINAYCGLRFVQYALRGKGGVGEPVHPDHVAYYSYSTLSLLLQRHGFDIESFYFYDLGLEHRPYNRAYLNWINDVLVKFSPQLSDGIVAVCKVGSR